MRACPGDDGRCGRGDAAVAAKRYWRSASAERMIAPSLAVALAIGVCWNRCAGGRGMVRARRSGERIDAVKKVVSIAPAG